MNQLYNTAKIANLMVIAIKLIDGITHLMCQKMLAMMFYITFG